MAIISCKDAAFSYDGTVVVAGLNFEVAEGDYLCIVGENGSGKSTLVKGLLGLKQPSAGTLLTQGIRSTQMGYLPQQTAAQRDFPASVFEVVLSGRLSSRGMKPFYGRQDKQTAMKNMARMSITNLKNHCYRELSGGQQQRVLLARALCASEKALLLDEPVAGLDPLVTQEMYQLIRQLNAEGMTIIMVSHDIRSAIGYASRVLHLKNRQEFFGTTAEYRHSPVGKHFLGGA